MLIIINAGSTDCTGILPGDPQPQPADLHAALVDARAAVIEQDPDLDWDDWFWSSEDAETGEVLAELPAPRTEWRDRVFLPCRRAARA